MQLDLQRKMLLAYEKQEQTRKVSVLAKCGRTSAAALLGSPVRHIKHASACSNPHAVLKLTIAAAAIHLLASSRDHVHSMML